MKRRRFFGAAIAAPAASALLGQQITPPNPTTQPPPGPNTPRQPGGEVPKVETAVADVAGDMSPRFFSAPQYAALRKLSDILMPPINGAPGALDAHAPEFLDFLIGQSPADRQQVYRAGLDALNAQARRRFNKAFADIENAQAAELLAPLREPWTYDPPADPLPRFLRAAKQDVRMATMNSQEYVTVAGASGGRRGFGGQGLYWYPLD
jgi:Gluconate 2-dehydrogenase subunit 3